MTPHTLSRRSFLAFSAMLPWALSARGAKSIPTGLELYSVREELKKDAEGTVRSIAQMGYQCVEFYAPYFEWSESQTKQMRKLLDDLGIHCFSTHNHQPEFPSVDGVRPMEILAKKTKPSVMLQLDVGTCLEAGSDPVAWIRANPGRIRSLHLKDWSPDPTKGYKVLFGEGGADWKNIFAAAESVGGVEYYLIEQEGSRFSELETARRCLQSFRATHLS